MVTVHAICYNEEYMLPFFINHYRRNFPNCRIVIHDNQSTDRSVQIALDNGCEVDPYDTGNKLSDFRFAEIKNNYWKHDQTPWSIVCDIDELLDINQLELEEADRLGATLIKSKGWHMCNKYGIEDIDKIFYGVRAGQYDKTLCFKKAVIGEINYSNGAHNCYPIGQAVYSDKAYNMRHMKYINEDYLVEKYRINASRLSPENIRFGMSGHYAATEQQIRDEYRTAINEAVDIYSTNG